MTNSQTTKKKSTKCAVTYNTAFKTAVKRVDSVFMGLGVPTALHYCVQKAGISTMTIGTMGTGKGVIKKLLVPADAFSIDLDSVTKTDLAEKFGEVKDMKLHVNIEEMASLSEYQKGIVTEVLAKVITDMNYQSVASKINIINCEMTMYCGIQPKTMSQMIAQSPTWESLADDRYLKIMLVNGLRNDDIEHHKISKEWYAESHQIFNDLFRIPLDSVKVDPEALNMIHRLLMNQISGNRVRNYSRNILKAWASMNNKKTATVALAELFIKLFGFYFMMFDTFTVREDIGTNLKFKGSLTTAFMGIACNYRFNFTKSDYVTMFRVDESVFRKHTEQLLEMQLIEIIKVPVVTPAGNRSSKGYILGGKVSEFFAYYAKTFGYKV